AGQTRARLSDLEEVKTLSLRTQAAAANQLESSQESTRTVAVRYPDETEFPSLAAEVDRIAKERPVVKPRKLEWPRFEKTWVPATVTRPVLRAAGAVLLVALVLALLFLIAHPRRSQPKPPPAIVLVPVQFHVSPRAATVRIDGKIQDTSQPVSLPAGRYQVEASLDGYESRSTTVGVTPGSAPVVNLVLRAVAQSFRITTPDLEDAEVYLDHQLLGKLEGGTLSNASAAPGQHNIRIQVRNAAEQASFSFSSSPDRPPRVELPLQAKRAELLVITSKGSLGSIAGTMSSATVKLDGHALGPLSPGGLELTDLEPGIHTVILGERDGARTMSFESGASPQLDAVVYSDRNVGSLLVVVGEDDADVYVDGRKYRHTTQGGELRIPNLEVRKHTIRVSKAGFHDADERRIAVVKGQETRVTFSLQALPKLASVKISHLPGGTRVEMDQKAPGTAVVAGEFSRSDITPGEHTIDLFATGFEPLHLSRKFAAGEEVRLTEHDLAFKRPMATLEVMAAADTGITIQRGNQTIKQSQGSARFSLEEGEYQITAHGPGRVDTFTAVVLAAGETKKIDLLGQSHGMELWPPGWTQESGWFTHRGGGFVLYGQPRLSGTIEFAAKLHRSHNPLAGGPRLRWVVNFLDDRNYLLFQMDGKYFYRVEVIDGNNVALPRIAHHIPERNEFVNLQIPVQPGRVEHRWNVNGEDWQVLDDLTRSTSPSLFTGKVQGFNDGRFGFFLPGTEAVEVSNFAYYPGGR
ncbi:MAG: PEGA domain-containing protein, partial [Acidobacteria bacterium]|nr:PEGA domain-containing protein [Acidobacteriota bacterium]